MLTFCVSRLVLEVHAVVDTCVDTGEGDSVDDQTSRQNDEYRQYYGNSRRASKTVAVHCLCTGGGLPESHFDDQVMSETVDGPDVPETTRVLLLNLVDVGRWECSRRLCHRP